MKVREEVWQPGPGIQALMYGNSMTPPQMREAILECWQWIFGQDPVFKGLLEKKFQAELVSMENLHKGSIIMILNYFEEVVKKFESQRKTCLQSLNKLKFLSNLCAEEDIKSKTIKITSEDSIVEARNSGLNLAVSIGFSKTNAVKVATAVSELARNIFTYVGQGQIELVPIIKLKRRGLKIIAQDHGPGINNLETILKGDYRSQRGLGIGLLGTKRLSDEFNIETAPNVGTTVVAVKYA